MAKKDFAKIFLKEQEENFWHEVELRNIYESQFQPRPPKQIQKRLLGKDPAPGERAALALYWTGLNYFNHAKEIEKEGEAEQTGPWLYEFDKARKAQKRLGERDKTTSHNLSLFEESWQEINKISQDADLEGYVDLHLSRELFAGFWVTAYFLSMAAVALHSSREHYHQALWTPGYQEGFKTARTPAKGFEYDRLLFRSACLTYDSQIDDLELLPNMADGWLSPRKEQPGILALADALKDWNSPLEDFLWTDEAFQVSLNNNCRIVVQPALESPIEPGIFQGLILVFTPESFFFEQVFMNDDCFFFEENCQITFPGNSLGCQPSGEGDPEKAKFEKSKKKDLRKKIIRAVAEAHYQPQLQEPINEVIKIAVEKQPVKKGRVLVPQGNLLYGDL